MLKQDAPKIAILVLWGAIIMLGTPKVSIVENIVMTVVYQVFASSRKFPSAQPLS